MPPINPNDVITQLQARIAEATSRVAEEGSLFGTPLVPPSTAYTSPKSGIPDAKLSDTDLEKVVGKLLAEGLTHEEIIEDLVAKQGLDVQGACAVVRRVYDSWSVVESALALTPEDLRRWHINLRRRMLRRFVNSPSVQDGRLTLSVLDSLATLQGIAEIPTVDHKGEIRIVFQDTASGEEVSHT